MSFSTNILESIDDLRFQSEIDVLISIGESYQKALDIFMTGDSDQIIVLESVGIFSESTGSSIVELFNKIFNFFKAAFSRFSNFIKKKFVNREKDLIFNINMLRIMEQLKTATKVTQEAASDEMDEDLYQEGLFSSTPSERLARDAQRHLKDEKKEAQKQLKSQQKMSKVLRKQYKRQDFYRELSEQEILDVVKQVTANLSTDEFNKLKNTLINAENQDIKKIEQDTMHNLMFLYNLSEYMGKTKPKLESIGKGYMTDERKSSMKDKVENNLEKSAQKHGNAKLKEDLKLLQEMADTLGKTLNQMSRRDNFSYDNLKSMVYGGRPVKSIFGSVANCLFGIIKNGKEILPRLSTYGDILYSAHHQLADYVEKDEETRKEMGLEVNKTIKAVMFILDNIKEETYGWDDDFFFNKQSYGNGDIAALSYGGPFTICMGIIMFALTKDASSIPSPDAASPIDVAFMAGSRALRNNYK